MTQEGRLPPPSVIWAQRNNILYVTICLEDCKDPVIKIEPEMMYFKGIGGVEKKMYEVTINLYGEIDPSKTVQTIRGRTLEFILAKQEAGPYWPRLTKEKTKAHWLKSDFNKWKDESDSDIEIEGNNLEDMMRHMGGLGGSGDSKPSYVNFDDMMADGGEGTDSDDEDLPDLIE
ncbi:PREDICTED: uncharacterized protein CG16817 [Dufourea novaeangliae]|uniref:uncharacterized protein CG16817 n=1 Tax=Dufourea novaeangliae TaxID=178035 RepID=UPI000767CAE2|nr:PREDICTED: uncharacterized protein CG16817 [Dufourea novaeangliae]